MKKMLSRIKDKYLNESLDFRAQIFNLLALIGMALGAVIAVSNIITNAGIINIAVCLLASALAFALLSYAHRSGRYKRCYLITVVSVFVIAFPVLFFTAGGYHSGMPAFFVFAVVFTVFMLESKIMYVLAAFEMILYLCVCLIAYHDPETVSFFATERDTVTDIVIGFTVASVALGIAVIRHTKIYDKKQKQLADANEALTQVDRMKTEFLGNISHELKTPLTVISGYAQTARRLVEREGEQSRAASEAMTLISSEAERLALMVGQVLDITRIEEGRMGVEKTACHADEIIHAAVNTHYPILNKNENRLDIRVEDDLPEIFADPARISQVIVNLIANAVRFTTNGRITVAAAARGSFVEISVTDTGIGIPPARLPFVFNRYYSQKPGGGQDTGTGLGLYICKHIVEAHGGAITVESAEGQGTTVRASLPAMEGVNIGSC